MLQLLLPSNYGDYEFTWLKLYGPIYRLKECFGQDRLMISDPLALQYILNSAQFAHGPIMENFIDLVYGEKSVLAVGGDTHKRLRAALNTGFTAAAVKNYRPVFEKMAQALTEQLEQSLGSSINISPLLSTATLGAVSEAVLGCSTQDLGEEFVANNCEVVVLASSLSAGQLLDPIQSESTKKGISEEMVVAQLETEVILLAGQDTTANSVAFGMPLLNAFIKETL
ncbi:hypothetical protein MVEN_01875200 [Mycena venus]|uniref:Cytochrome P450 n=1 Tax=Mycena venus TaxID=2733690 RepID=A0A8H6XHX9_9AGAR|nr:hypothetical protein MVEN_01875200 [Mycena venus]